MSTGSAGRDYDLAPVKFSRLSRRGVLLGLSGSQLVVVGMGAATLVVALYLGGGALLLYVAPMLLLCAALTWVGIGGRKLVEWLPVVARWVWRSTGDQLLFRRRIVRPRPVGTLALPGDAARLRQWLDPESGAVMIHDPHRSTLTAIVSVTHPAFILLDPIEQQRRVAELGPCPGHRLSVRTDCVPAGDGADMAHLGRGLAQWWSQHGMQDELVDIHDVRRTHRPCRSRRRTSRKHRLDLTRHESCWPCDSCRGRWQPRRCRSAAPGDVDDHRGPEGCRPRTIGVARARRPGGDPAFGIRPRPSPGALAAPR